MGQGEEYIDQSTEDSARALALEIERALGKIADYQGRRDHSLLELREKLRRHFTEEIYEYALKKAEEFLWLSDEKELAIRVAEQLHRKLKSYRYINGHLKKKGLEVPPRQEEIEVEKAASLFQMKFGNLESIDYAIRLKVFRYLSYRGYDSAVIQKVIHEEY